MVADRWAALLDGQSEGGFAPARTSALSSAVMLAARAKWILTRQAFQAEGDVSEAMTHKLSHWGTPIGPEPIVEPHGLIADVDGNPVAALRPSQWRRRPSRLALRFMATRLGNPKSARLSSHRFPSSCVPTQPCPALRPICSGSQVFGQGLFRAYQTPLDPPSWRVKNSRYDGLAAKRWSVARIVTSNSPGQLSSPRSGHLARPIRQSKKCI